MTELDETLTKDIVKRALTNKPKDKSHHDTQKKDPTDLRRNDPQHFQMQVLYRKAAEYRNAHGRFARKNGYIADSISFLVLVLATGIGITALTTKWLHQRGIPAHNHPLITTLHFA